jgi:hypothetical protein
MWRVYSIRRRFEPTSTKGRDIIISQSADEENESFEVYKHACSPVKVREARKRQINFL